MILMERFNRNKVNSQNYRAQGSIGSERGITFSKISPSLLNALEIPYFFNLLG